jgi:uncharacterized metal-binding protein YceD (DUF177 family)
MTFFQRLMSRFTRPAPTPGRNVQAVTVQCLRCGEVITAPLDLRNDLSVDYDEASGATSYICRKVLMGRQRCFQQIEVTLHFDQDRKLVSKEVTGGKFVEPTAAP